MTKEPHRCGDRCTCPIHRTPLLYAAYTDQHACQEVNCPHGHGMRTTLFTSIAWHSGAISSDGPQ